MKSGIYTITNNVNGKIYIGSSVNIDKRLNEHQISLINNTHYNTHLQNAWNQYGKESFLLEELERCEKDFLHSQENWWCNMLNVHNRQYGYNIAGINPYTSNGKISEETKRKISIANKGRKHSDEMRKKCSERLKGKPGFMTGRKFTPEQIKRLSESHKGKIPINVDNFKKPLLQYDKDGNFIRKWSSTSEACKTLCISSVVITKNIKRGIPKTSCNRKGKNENYNFIWKYKIKEIKDGQDNH